MDSYIKPDSQTFFINDVFAYDEYFSSYSQKQLNMRIPCTIFISIGLHYQNLYNLTGINTQFTHPCFEGWRWSIILAINKKNCLLACQICQERKAAYCIVFKIWIVTSYFYGLFHCNGVAVVQLSTASLPKQRKLTVKESIIENR